MYGLILILPLTLTLPEAWYLDRDTASPRVRGMAGLEAWHGMAWHGSPRVRGMAGFVACRSHTSPQPRLYSIHNPALATNLP